MCKRAVSLKVGGASTVELGFAVEGPAYLTAAFCELGVAFNMATVEIDMLASVSAVVLAYLRSGPAMTVPAKTVSSKISLRLDIMRVLVSLRS